jgi:Putative zinc-finger
MGSDSDTMSCAEFQDAISAIVDHEQSGIDPFVVELHVASCVECAAFERSSIDLRRRLGIRQADEPDHSRRIAPLAAIADRAASWRAPRIVLFVVAVEVLVLSAFDMFAASGDAADVHDSRHLSAFTLAYGVLLLLVVVRPARARTALPVAVVLAGALVITAIADRPRPARRRGGAPPRSVERAARVPARRAEPSAPGTPVAAGSGRRRTLHQARVIENAGITRGAAEAMYSPKFGCSSAWARRRCCPSPSGNSTTLARNDSVPYSTVMSGVAFRL